MNDKVRLGTIRLVYYVQGGPITTMDFVHQLVTTLKSSVNDIRVFKLEAGYDMFTGSTSVSLEIQPGEQKEKELREVFKQFESPSESSWESIQAHLWSLWVRREDGTGYTQMATGSRDYLCTRAEAYATDQWPEKWQWFVDPRADKGSSIGQLGRKPEHRSSLNDVDLFLQHGTQRQGWMGITQP